MLTSRQLFELFFRPFFNLGLPFLFIFLQLEFLEQPELTDGKERVPVNSGGFLAGEEQRCHLAAVQEAGIVLGQRQPLQLLRQGRHGSALGGKEPPEKTGGGKPRQARR